MTQERVLSNVCTLIKAEQVIPMSQKTLQHANSIKIDNTEEANIPEYLGCLVKKRNM